MNIKENDSLAAVATFHGDHGSKAKERTSFKDHPDLFPIPASYRPATHITARRRIPLGQWRRADGSTFIATGRQQQTLELLHRHGLRGVEAFDFPGGPAYRLPAYVHRLRWDYGLTVCTERERHDGGWHARYVLDCQVSPEPFGGEQ